MTFRLRLIVALAAISLFTFAAAAQIQVALPIYSPAPASSSPADFTKVGTKVYFTAATLNEGRELWITNGTAAGTLLVKDITPGTASSPITSMVEFKGYLYFVLGRDLWRSNGTAAGTVFVKSLDSGGAWRLNSAGTLLYMVSGGQLWVSDGTSARTFRVRSFWTTIESPFGFEGKLFFSTAEDSLLGKQAWVSDGTLFGTRVLSAGNACPMAGCAADAEFFRLGTKLLFVARTSWQALGDLWLTDGTAAGTQLVRANTGGVIAQSSAVAYLAAGSNLIVTNGTSAGTSVVKTFEAAVVGGAVAGNTLFFDVGDYYSPSGAVWKSDGTAAGTTLLMSQPRAGWDVSERGATATRYVFTNASTTTGAEPWVSDGTPAGTTLLKDLMPGEPSSHPRAFFGMGNYTLFVAASENEGAELWRTDGTTAGTYRVMNIAPEQLTGEITGLVRDATTSTPIAGASVAVYDRSSRLLVTVTTGNDGAYRIDKLTTDGYYLRATTATHVPQAYPNLNCAGCWPVGRQVVQVTAGMQTTGVDFSLSAGGLIAGKVTHAGKAVAQSQVTLYDAADRAVVWVNTAADGTYRSPFGLPPGTYYAIARSPLDAAAAGQIYGGGPCADHSYYSSPCVASLTGKSITASAGKTTTAINFALPSFPRISGRVTTSLGQPISALTIRVYSATSAAPWTSTVTNAAGEYVTSPIAPGSYVVAAIGDDKRYVSQVYHNQNCTAACDPLAGRPISVNYDEVATAIDFALHPKAGVIRGTLKDAVTGQAVDVPIVLYHANGNVAEVDGNDWWSDAVDAAGNFELRNVQPGTYFLKTGTRLYNGFDCQSCDVTTGTPIVIASVDTIVNLTIAYPHTVQLSGTLTSSDTGLPIASASVAWRRASDGYELDSTITDAHGKWSLSEPTAPAHLVFNSGFHVPEAWNDQSLACPSCPIPSGAIVFDPAAIATDRADLNAALAKRPAISGTIRDHNGQALYGTVRFYTSTGTPAASQYASGAYTWRPTVPGTYFAVAEVDVGNARVRQLYARIECAADCTVTAGTPITAAPGATISDIDFVFNTSPPVVTAVTGLVVDDAGKPISGAFVDIARTDYGYAYWSHVATTDVDGRYSIRLSPGGSYKMRARKEQSAFYTKIYGGISCVSEADCTLSSGGTTIVAQSGTTATIDIRLPTVAVTSIAPRLGPPSGGTRVTLTGTNFSSAFQVSFDSVPAKIVSITATEIVVLTPLGSVGSAHVRIFGGEVSATVLNAFTYVTAAAGDINGDFRGDVFWRNTSTGANDAWLMDGRFGVVTRTYDAYVAAWEIQTLGDFNGDGFADVFWRNTTTGANKVWFMRNTQPQYVTLSTVALEWRVIGSGDFDLDGKADLLWRNNATGGNAIWFGTGTGFRPVVITASASPWQPQLVADLSGDGRADILWQNTTTLEVTAWLMNGTTRTVRPLGTVASGWRAAAAGDTDGDGLADVLWRKDSTGDQSLWLMNVSAPYYVSRPLARTGTTWMPIGMTDVTGDGRADILWRNSSNGQPTVWSMNGATQVSAFSLPTRDLNWKPYLAH